MPGEQVRQTSPGAHIEDVCNTWDQRAIQAKSQCRRWDLVQTVFPPLAALLLSIQIIAFPEVSVTSIALIGMELLVLFIALVMAMFRADSAVVRWVPFRLRAEVLRREKYLLETRVGPYLHCEGAAELEAAVQARLAILDGETGDACEAVRLAEPNGEPWRDQLEDARAGDIKLHRLGGELPQIARRYYEERLLGQKSFYRKRIHQHDRSNDIWAMLCKVTLAAALVAAAMHLTALLMAEGHPGAMTTWIEIAAIALPPISAAFSEVQALLQGRRLARSYACYETELALLEARFADLLSQIHPDDDSDRVSSQTAFRFRRLVLEAEELFAAETRTWWVLMAPCD